MSGNLDIQREWAIFRDERNGRERCCRRGEWKRDVGGGNRRKEERKEGGEEAAHLYQSRSIPRFRIFRAPSRQAFLGRRKFFASK
jgi:sulfatase maturation enzyme AslB (radical SAM superfamily)